MTPEDERMTRTREICLALPEAVENTDNPLGRPSYRIRDKIFAYYLDNHHNDGRLAVWMKAAPGVQESLVRRDPVRFFAPPYVGPKGWIGVRLDQGEIDWDELADMIEQSYRLVAPRRVAARLNSSPD